MTILVLTLEKLKLKDRLYHAMSFRWFCDLDLTEQSSDQIIAFFIEVETLLGTKRIAKVFSAIRDSTVEKNIIREVSHFVDSTVIKSKNGRLG